MEQRSFAVLLVALLGASLAQAAPVHSSAAATANRAAVHANNAVGNAYVSPTARQTQHSAQSRASQNAGMAVEKSANTPPP
jgi:hypothetical protein